MKKKSLNPVVRENLIGYCLIAPAFILVLCIGVLPIFNTFSYSLQNYQLTKMAENKFIGIENYIYLLTEDKYFYTALWNTIRFAFFSVLLQLIVGFLGAMLMHKAKRGVTVVRAAVLIPWAIPGIIVAQMWSFMFNDQLGVINQLLATAGLIDGNITWLADGFWAFIAILLTDTWKQFPFVALMLLAGLQTIPYELYESADVDGAGPVRKFFSITLPNLKPILLVVLLFRTMGALRMFDIVFSMTGGGPANATTTLLLQAYNYYFKDLNYGKGSAMATVIFVMILVMSIIYIRVFKTDED